MFSDAQDRYLQQLDESKAHKIKSAYWTTKQAMIKKFRRKEDENVVASDADLDAKLTLLKSVQTTCRDLNLLVVRYQDTLLYLSQSESEMARFLKQQSLEDKTQAGKIMLSVGKALSSSAQQRLLLRAPLDRLQQEVKTFRQRGIADTTRTLKRMETARTEYRGALLWMKNTSEELDPDTYKQMEKFRCVQAQVRKNKEAFDRLKIDSMQKIDLLSASRCNMLSHALVAYQDGLVSFFEKSSRNMAAVADRFKGHQYYGFNILKHLREDSQKLSEQNQDDDDSELNLDNDTSNVSKEAETSTVAKQQLETEEENEKEKELDRQLDEILRVDDENADDIAAINDLLQLDSANVGGKESGALKSFRFLKGFPGSLSEPNRCIPSEHKDLLMDLFMTVDDYPPPTGSFSSNVDGGSTQSNSQFTLINKMAPLTDSLDRRTQLEKSASGHDSDQASTQQPDSSPLFEKTPWDGFGSTSGSSLLPSQLLDKVYDGSSWYQTASESSTTQSNTIQHWSSTAPTQPTSSTTSSDQTAQSKTQTPSNLDAWMNLFSDMDPIGNPDTISKKDGQITDA